MVWRRADRIRATLVDEKRQRFYRVKKCMHDVKNVARIKVQRFYKTPFEKVSNDFIVSKWQKKRNQIIVYSFQKIAFRFRIDLTDKRTTFLLCSWIIVKLSCVSYRVWKSLLNYRDVFLRRWICRHFCDAFWAIVDSGIPVSGIPVFPFIRRLFFRRGDCLSVKAMVSPIESLVSSNAATEEPSCQI